MGERWHCVRAWGGGGEHFRHGGSQGEGAQSPKVTGDLVMMEEADGRM